MKRTDKAKKKLTDRIVIDLAGAWPISFSDNDMSCGDIKNGIGFGVSEAWPERQPYERSVMSMKDAHRLMLFLRRAIERKYRLEHAAMSQKGR